MKKKRVPSASIKNYIDEAIEDYLEVLERKFTRELDDALAAMDLKQTEAWIKK